MRKITAVAALALVLLANNVWASASRAKVVDQNQGFIEDSVDVNRFTNLYDSYPNRLSLNHSATTKGTGYLGLGPGVLALTLGDFSYSGADLYSFSSDMTNKTNFSGNSNGTTTLSPSASVPSLIDNSFNVLTPGHRFSVAYGMGLVGLGFEFATSNRANKYGQTNQDGKPMFISTAAFQAFRAEWNNGVMSNSWASAAGGLSQTAIEDSQSSTGITLKPGFGINNDSFGLNIGMTLGLDSVNNMSKLTFADMENNTEVAATYTVKSLNPVTRFGLDTQFALKAETSKLVLNLKGLYSNTNLRHTYKDEVSKGTLKVGASNYNGISTDIQEMNQGSYAMSEGLGLVKDVEKTKSTLVFGLTANQTWSWESYTCWNQIDTTNMKEQPEWGSNMGVGPGVKTGNKYVNLKGYNAGYEFSLPILIGIEQVVTPWAKLRGSMSRSLYSYKTGLQRKYFVIGGGDSTPSAETNNAEYYDTGLIANTISVGAGLTFGNIIWDTELGANSLCTNGTMQNPVANSSITYKW
jgi:hypothetical protein